MNDDLTSRETEVKMQTWKSSISNKNNITEHNATYAIHIKTHKATHTKWTNTIQNTCTVFDKISQKSFSNCGIGNNTAENTHSLLWKIQC